MKSSLMQDIAYDASDQSDLIISAVHQELFRNVTLFLFG